MNCLAFERLLDEGEPGALPAIARAHAAECARCARALARARSLEVALAAHFSAAQGPADELPLDFTERVLWRVQRGEARGVRWLSQPDALPWWVRAAADPSAALAMVVAALLLWRGDQVLVAIRAGFPGLQGLPGLDPRALGFGTLLDSRPLEALAGALGQAFVPASSANWSVSAAMAIGLAPVVMLVGYGLWRMGERLAGATVPVVLR